MISLYPSHIHISFPCSHILPYPYISHIHVLIFLSVSPVALPLVFFHFLFFCGMGTGCVFLVVFWCRCCGFSSSLSFRFSLRSVARPAFRSAFRFVSSVLFLAPLFAQPSRFVYFVLACRGRFVGRAVFVSSLGAGGRLFFFVS